LPITTGLSDCKDETSVSEELIIRSVLLRGVRVRLVGVVMSVIVGLGGFGSGRRAPWLGREDGRLGEGLLFWFSFWPCGQRGSPVSMRSRLWQQATNRHSGQPRLPQLTG